MQKGKLEALNKDEAVSVVKEDGVLVIEIKENVIGRFASLKKQNKLSSFERINFTDHLASLIRAGTPLKDALEAYSDEKSEGAEVINQIIGDVERGKQLSEAFAKHPAVFPPLYVSLIKAGETAGNLDETLEYLANELRREHEFVQRVKSALFYPLLVLGVSILVMTFIITVIVPRILQIAESLGGDIPLMTRIMLSFSGFISKNAGIIGLVLAITSCLIAYSLTKVKVRNEVGKKLLRAPIVGKIQKKYILSRFMRVIASSVRYGIPLTVAFDSAAEVVGNIRYGESCENINNRIQKGVSMSDSIAAEGRELFPGIIIRSLRGAEKTGGIDAALNRLSLQFEREVDRELKKLTELLEPVLVVVMGMIVLFIALSVVMPMYQLTSNLN